MEDTPTGNATKLMPTNEEPIAKSNDAVEKLDVVAAEDKPDETQKKIDKLQEKITKQKEDSDPKEESETETAAPAAALVPAPAPTPTPVIVLPEELRNAVKLFVGQIPQGTVGSEIEPLFQAYGKVLNVYMIKNKNDGPTSNTNGEKNGPASCAFVTYSSYEAAKACIDAVHNQVTLPNGPGPLQISLAKGEGERLGLDGFEEKVVCKLFFGMLPYSYGETEIRSLLSPAILEAQHVQEVHVLRKNGGTGDSKGSAFVRILGEKNAQMVISALNEKVQLPGAPNMLNVSVAAARGSVRQPSHGFNNNNNNHSNNTYNNSQPRGSMPLGPPSSSMLGVKRPRESSSGEQYPPHQRMRVQPQNNVNNAAQQIFKLHVANLAFHVAEKDVSELFGRFGHIVEVYLLRDRANGQSKGAGFVKFTNQHEAEAAIAGINGTLQFGFERPLRVSFALAKNGQSHAAPHAAPQYQSHSMPPQQPYYSAAVPTPRAPYPAQQYHQYPPPQQYQQYPQYQTQQRHQYAAAPGMPPPPQPPSRNVPQQYQQWGYSQTNAAPPPTSNNHPPSYYYQQRQ